MVENVLMLTSKIGTELGGIFEKAQLVSDTGKHVRILLFGDAVLETGKQTTNQRSKLELFVCKEDLERRGLAKMVDPVIKVIDYDDIVELLMKNDDHIINYV